MTYAISGLGTASAKQPNNWQAVEEQYGPSTQGVLLQLSSTRLTTQLVSWASGHWHVTVTLAFPVGRRERRKHAPKV